MKSPLKNSLVKDSLEKRLEIAKVAAREAAAVQRAYYQKAFDITTKSSGIDLVTSVDHQCDALIRGGLTDGARAAGLPDATLITEETYEEGSVFDLHHAWLVDPLDGTTNYAHGFPHFAVSIAFMAQGQPVVGLVYDTMRDEMFTAIKGQGAFLNGVPIQVSRTQTLDCSLLATGFPYDTHIKPEDNIAYFLSFMSLCHGVRRAGSAALDLVYVACGRLDGFWELRLSPWDVAAGSLIVTEAGGHISDFYGNSVDHSRRRIDILGAGQGSLLKAISWVCQGNLPSTVRS